MGDDMIPLPPPPAPPVPSALAWAPLGTFLGMRGDASGVSYSPRAIAGAYWPWVAAAGGLVVLLLLRRRR